MRQLVKLNFVVIVRICVEDLQPCVAVADAHNAAVAVFDVVIKSAARNQDFELGAIYLQRFDVGIVVDVFEDVSLPESVCVHHLETVMSNFRGFNVERTSGRTNCRTAGLRKRMDCRTDGLLDGRTIGRTDCRTDGLQERRIEDERTDCRTDGLWERWTAEKTDYRTDGRKDRQRRN